MRYKRGDGGAGITTVATDATLTGNGTGGSPLHAVKQIDLYTDGVLNATQNKLNLIGGTGITLTDDGLGNITIDNSGAGGGAAAPLNAVQFNNPLGDFDGNADFTYVNATGAFRVGNTDIGTGTGTIIRNSAGIAGGSALNNGTISGSELGSIAFGSADGAFSVIGVNARGGYAGGHAISAGVIDVTGDAAWFHGYVNTAGEVNISGDGAIGNGVAQDSAVINATAIAARVGGFTSGVDSVIDATGIAADVWGNTDSRGIIRAAAIASTIRGRASGEDSSFNQSRLEIDTGGIGSLLTGEALGGAFALISNRGSVAHVYVSGIDGSGGRSRVEVNGEGSLVVAKAENGGYFYISGGAGIWIGGYAGGSNGTGQRSFIQGGGSGSLGHAYLSNGGHMDLNGSGATGLGYIVDNGYVNIGGSGSFVSMRVESAGTVTANASGSSMFGVAKTDTNVTGNGEGGMMNIVADSDSTISQNGKASRLSASTENQGQVTLNGEVGLLHAYVSGSAAQATLNTKLASMFASVENGQVYANGEVSSVYAKVNDASGLVTVEGVVSQIRVHIEGPGSANVGSSAYTASTIIGHILNGSGSGGTLNVGGELGYVRGRVDGNGTIGATALMATAIGIAKNGNQLGSSGENSVAWGIADSANFGATGANSWAIGKDYVNSDADTFAIGYGQMDFQVGNGFVDLKQSGLKDSAASVGTAGYHLSSDGIKTLWVDAPRTLVTYLSPSGNTAGGGSATNIYDYTLPANTINIPGRGFTGEFNGFFVASPTATRRIRVWFGGQLIFSSGNLTTLSTDNWTLTMTILDIDGNNILERVQLTTTGGVQIFSVQNIGSLDLSVDNHLLIEATADGTGSAADDIVGIMGRILYQPAA